MKNELKNEMIDFAKRYMADKNISQAELARRAGINAGYLSTILNGVFVVNVGGKPVAIADKYFMKLAETTGFKIEKEYWPVVPTPQFVTIIGTLEQCKATGKSGMIVGDTGSGKTFATDIFMKKKPQYTYKVTVSSLHSINDVLEELCRAMGIESKHRKLSKLHDITIKLSNIRREGGRPIIIIDESENMKQQHFQMIKSLYDFIRNYCSVVMVGTSQLVNKLNKLTKRNKEGIPQLYRRFRAGVRTLPELDRSFDLFFSERIADKGLRKLLCSLCNNYGELNDYLEPAIREADIRGEELTEIMFRTMYNIN